MLIVHKYSTFLVHEVQLTFAKSVFQQCLCTPYSWRVLYWQTYLKEGFNPISNQQVFTERQRIKVNLELPMNEEYSGFIRNLIETISK